MVRSEQRNGRPEDAADDALRQKLRQQEEVIARLRSENDTLVETVAQKDAAIHELLRSVQSIPEERSCSKTASTSRESDEHLRDREVAVLQRKNNRLKKDIQGKQQTIKELLRAIGRFNAQNVGDSSAFEEEPEEYDDEEDASSGGEPSPLQAARVASGSSAKAAASALQTEATMIGSSAPSSPAKGSAAPAVAAAAAGGEALSVAKRPRNEAIRMGDRSIAALEALAREMKVLEDKKRTVEQLAGSLDCND